MYFDYFGSKQSTLSSFSLIFAATSASFNIAVRLVISMLMGSGCNYRHRKLFPNCYFELHLTLLFAIPIKYLEEISI